MSLEQTMTADEVDPSNDLRVLYELHASEAGRLAYLLTGDRHLAEDLVHEAFIRAGLRFAHLRSTESFPAYLRRTIVNLCRSHWRRESVRRAFVQRTRPPEPSYQPDLGQRSEVASTLRQLSPRQRMAVVLRYYEDLSEEQAADMLGCSTAALKSLIHRAKDTLRGELGGTHGEL
jgi:RNA polymerase sigma-70 factor (sigma-E family)